MDDNKSFLARFGGEWVYAEDGVNKYLGRVVSLGIEKGVPIDKAEALNNWQTKNVISLSPVFQYISRLVPQQTAEGTSIARDSAALPYDLMLDDKARIFLKPVMLTFLSEMDGRDRQQYQSLIENCADIMAKTRFAASGLTLASSMPSNGSLIQMKR